MKSLSEILHSTQSECSLVWHFTCNKHNFFLYLLFLFEGVKNFHSGFFSPTGHSRQYTLKRQWLQQSSYNTWVMWEDCWSLQQVFWMHMQCCRYISHCLLSVLQTWFFSNMEYYFQQLAYWDLKVPKCFIGVIEMQCSSYFDVSLLSRVRRGHKPLLPTQFGVTLTLPTQSGE